MNWRWVGLLLMLWSLSSPVWNPLRPSQAVLQVSVSVAAISSLDALRQFVNLEVLSFNKCPLIADLSPLTCLKDLHQLSFGDCPQIKSLEALTHFPKLEYLRCIRISHQTSFLPLTSCSKFRFLVFDPNAVDIGMLRAVNEASSISPRLF